MTKSHFLSNKSNSIKTAPTLNFDFLCQIWNYSGYNFWTKSCILPWCVRFLKDFKAIASASQNFQLFFTFSLKIFMVYRFFTLLRIRKKKEMNEQKSENWLTYFYWKVINKQNANKIKHDKSPFWICDAYKLFGAKIQEIFLAGKIQNRWKTPKYH